MAIRRDLDPDAIIWEARYRDGTALRQTDGPYGDIKREHLSSMALTYEDEDIIELYVPADLMGRFFYRRRTRMTQGGPHLVQFMLGFFPEGPIYVYDVESGEVFNGLAHEAHDVADFSLPIPHPNEGEEWLAAS